MPDITKIYTFCAAHQYHNSSWDEKANYAVFGDDVKVHGHNYELEITVSGPVDPSSGFVTNLNDLNDLVNSRIIGILDHSQIEKDIPWFKGKQPSTENLTIFIWESLVSAIEDPAYLKRIRIKETPTIYTEYYGPEGEKHDAG
ncbi:MAG: 6-carboxytetrahydropterin synthase [Fidelibacterota bacterium]